MISLSFVNTISGLRRLKQNEELVYPSRSTKMSKFSQRFKALSATLRLHAHCERNARRSKAKRMSRSELKRTEHNAESEKAVNLTLM